MITIEDFEKAIGQLGIVQHDNSSEREVAEKCFELAKQYASSSSEKGDGPTPEERLIGWLDAQIMGVQALPFFTESQKQESEMLVSRYKKVKEKVLEYLKPVTNQSSKQFQFSLEEVVRIVHLWNQYIVQNEEHSGSLLAINKFVENYDPSNPYKSLTPKEHSEGEAERNIDNLTSF